MQESRFKKIRELPRLCQVLELINKLDVERIQLCEYYLSITKNGLHFVKYQCK